MRKYSNIHSSRVGNKINTKMIETINGCICLGWFGNLLQGFSIFGMLSIPLWINWFAKNFTKGRKHD